MPDPHDAGPRPVLDTSPPLFRPFFCGGLGVLALGAALIGRPVAARSPDGSADAPPLAGVGLFLAVFGAFVASVPMVGRMPLRKQVLVDLAAGRLIRRDRTLLRLRQVSYPLDEVQCVEVEELRHVDGDPYFTLVLRLDAGESVTLDRFTARDAADRAARAIRDSLHPINPAPHPPPI